MDFYWMSTKAKRNKEHNEDFLTELIAFMCNISDVFKKIYIEDFLELKEKKEKYKKLEMVTQERKEEENTDKSRKKKKDISIPDLVIKQGKRYIAICEHKITADIQNIEGENQLDKYSKNYKEVNEKFLIKPKSKIYNLSKKTKEKWEEKNWEMLFTELNSALKKKDGGERSYWDYKRNHQDFLKKNKNGIIFDYKLIYFFMDYLESLGLYDLDLDYFSDEYKKGINELCKKAKESAEFYEKCRKLLRSLKNNARGSKIHRFFENGYIYIKMGKLDYYGIEQDDENESYFYRKNNGKDEPFPKLELKELKSYNEEVELFKYGIDNEEFKKKFDKSVTTLDDFFIFFEKIIKKSCIEAGLNLKGKIGLDFKTKRKDDDKNSLSDDLFLTFNIEGMKNKLEFAAAFYNKNDIEFQILEEKKKDHKRDYKYDCFPINKKLNFTKKSINDFSKFVGNELKEISK